MAELPATSTAPAILFFAGFLGQSPRRGGRKDQGEVTGRAGLHSPRPALAGGTTPRIKSGAGPLPRCGNWNARTPRPLDRKEGVTVDVP